MNPQWLTIAIVKDDRLTTSQRLYFEDMLREEFEKNYNDEFGIGNWLITPTDALPVDFSVETYTIMDGKLVRASAKVVTERKARMQAAANVAEIERLKAYLTSTDWAVVKCAELGVPLAELYPEVAVARAAARARINLIE